MFRNGGLIRIDGDKLEHTISATACIPAEYHTGVCALCDVPNILSFQPFQRFQALKMMQNEHFQTQIQNHQTCEN